MRAVEANWYRDFLFNLSNTKNRYDKSISQTTSGKKLNHLSDNPSDMAYVLTLRSKIGQIDQFQKNIETGLSFLKISESALNSVQNAMTTVVSLGEQGASETSDPAARQILADRLDEIRDEILNYANTEVNGKYVFAGSAADTPPYAKAADTVDPVSGVTIPGVVTYDGNSDTISIQADFSVTLPTNVPGNQVFGENGVAEPPYDVFQHLSNLIEGLRENDTTAIGNEVSNMKPLVNQLGNAMGKYGNWSAQMDQIKGMLKSFKTSLTSKMSSLEDANMAEAISNLAREEVALQVTLQSGSRIQRYSLMNYLG